MKPKLLIFDLFGTLIFQAPKVKKEDYFAFYQKLGIQLQTEENIKSFIRLFTQIMRLSSSWQEVSQRLLEKTIGAQDKNKTELLANFLKENTNYQIFDDAKEIINLPHKKAILTDASQFLFSNLGLEKHFEIFTPKETKFLKPDPKAFLAVLDFFKAKPEEVLMIGDELERDLIPAKNLGMDTILIDREDKVKNPPVKKINSLIEIKKILI